MLVLVQSMSIAHTVQPQALSSGIQETHCLVNRQLGFIFIVTQIQIPERLN